MAVLTAPESSSTPTSTTTPWKARRRESGPIRYMERPPIRLSRNWGRAESGMIITAKKETSEVKIML